ncbi:YeiH family protein [Desulfitibacter alkalitolerans]|uniref:YeiH family protein n=1 Tax=Desulfitibacter alkalitolerans TaxID=264641 RepID=UPI000486AC25|nr:putative sulfate exporter family transporter [Desulfitibacter alkalitolerans]
MSSPKKDYSFLIKHEDYWAIWLGVIILIVGMFVFFGNPPANMNQIIAESNATMQAEAEKAPFKTVAWHQANDAKTSLRGSNTPLARDINKYFTRPGRWSDNPLQSFFRSPAEAQAIRDANIAKHEEAKASLEAAKEAAIAAEAAAAAANFQDTALNAEAQTKISEWRSARSAESSAKGRAETKPYNHLTTMIPLMIFLALFFAIGTRFMGRSATQFLVAFPAVFVVATLSFFLAAHEFSNAWGLEYVLWAIVLGFLVSNTVGTPKWIMPAVQTEYYIKTGLVLLGSTILMNKILLIGIPGIFVTWFVTPVVLITTFWFGQKVLKIESKTLNITVSADMSVSGVSAAIAAAAASRAKKEELTLAVGISILFTAVMMVVLPMVIKFLGLHPVLGGAWIGGTIDSTGAVVAAGEILGSTARDVAATIKMIQNILIGLMAFGIAAYWCLKVDTSRKDEADLSFKGALREIWNRFPKFVLGFIGASIVFSIIYASMGNESAKVLIDDGISGFVGNLQRWLFALAFASIGLSTNFRELTKYFKGGKPVILYVCGQSFNILLTLTVAYIMFFVVFPGITESLMR